MIKAILFDLDDTLLDRDATIALYIEACYTRYRGALGHVPYEVFFDRFVRLDEHGYAERQRVFQTLISEFAPDLTVEEWAADFRENAWARCRSFPDMPEVLAQLRLRNYKLGIVTNGSVASQRAKIQGLGLAAWMDTILISEEEAARKPDAVLFLRAAERLGVRSDECLFVGDNPVLDIVGPHGVGMRTAWCKRLSDWPHTLSVVPTYTIRDLRELLTADF